MNARERKLRDQLAASGNRREAALRERSAASAELQRLVYRAADAGMTPTDIASVAGVSRQVVHSHLAGRAS